jgi:hypothetical protein
MPESNLNNDPLLKLLSEHYFEQLVQEVEQGTKSKPNEPDSTQRSGSNNIDRSTDNSSVNQIK